MTIRNVGGQGDNTAMIMMIMEMRAQERRASEKQAQSDRQFNLQMEQFKSQASRQERSERLGREDTQLKQIAEQYGVKSKEYREAAAHFGRFSPSVSTKENDTTKSIREGTGILGLVPAASKAAGEVILGKENIDAAGKYLGEGIVPDISDVELGERKLEQLASLLSASENPQEVANRYMRINRNDPNAELDSDTLLTIENSRRSRSALDVEEKRAQQNITEADTLIGQVEKNRAERNKLFGL